MASIQQSMSSAFNSLLAAAYTGTRAVKETDAYKTFEQERALVKNQEKRQNLIKGLTGDSGDLTQVENIDLLNDLVSQQAQGAKDLVLNHPTTGNVERFHRVSGNVAQLQPYLDKEIARRADLTPEQAALEAQQREINRKRDSRTGLAQRQQILGRGGEN